MIDLGTVRPGSTIRIPFSSFDKDDGSSITMTNYAAADILVYKDGGTTERASTAGFTATTDFDAKTGKHLAVIDLADNTTAGFWSAGSEYLVAIDAVTVDAVTTGGWIARFRIGYRQAVLDTTIATLSSQTSFTLTVGPAEDDALNGMWAIIHDIASAVQWARVLILDYTGSTKTVTLAAGGTFTAAAGDNFSVIDMAPLQAATLGRTLVVDSAGLADANAVKLGPTGSGTALTARDIGASVLLSSGTGTGQVTLTSGRVNADLTHIAAAAVSTTTAQLGVNVVQLSGDATAADNAESFFDGTGYAGTNNVIPTVSTLTGHTAQTGDAYARLGAPAGASVSADVAAVKTDTGNLVTRITSTLFSGITSMAQWLGLIAGKQTGNSTARTELRATGAGSGTFDETTDSIEALRDRGDSAWATATGFATAANLATIQGNVTDILADTADMQPKLGTPAGASISADIAAIEAQTDDIGAAGAGLTAVPWNAAWDADVQSEVADALAAYGAATQASVDDLPTNAELATALGTADDAVLAQLAIIQLVTNRLNTLLEGGAGSPGEFRFSADALVNAPSGGGGGGAPTASQIADAVWDELLSGHAISGSAGEALSAAGGAGDPWITALPGAYGNGTAGSIVGNILSRLATMLEPAGGSPGEYKLTADSLRAVIDRVLLVRDEVWTSTSRTLTAIDEDSTTLDLDATIRAAVGLASANLDTQLGDLPTNAELATSQAAADDATLAAIAGLSIPSAGAIADAVWDEAAAGHVGAGSTGLALVNTDLRGSRTVIRGTSAGSATTTTMTPSALSPAGVDADQFKGRILIFDNDTATTALRGQATDITANTAAGLPLLTFTALTTAPASGDTFSIV